MRANSSAMELVARLVLLSLFMSFGRKEGRSD